MKQSEESHNSQKGASEDTNRHGGKALQWRTRDSNRAQA